mmetsp:Transcript_5857/g.7739  ORF Transcript_5857/g.7739 Transcript_5857/m.7739 type:complete len:86 (-) Transcript_5857:551-808(-)
MLHASDFDSSTTNKRNLPQVTLKQQKQTLRTAYNTTVVQSKENLSNPCNPTNKLPSERNHTSLGFQIWQSGDIHILIFSAFCFKS